MTRALTEQQVTILCWVAGGATGQQIADELGTSMSAVNNSLYEARAKLGASNTTHMVAIAYQRGILEIEKADDTPSLDGFTVTIWQRRRIELTHTGCSYACDYPELPDSSVGLAELVSEATRHLSRAHGIDQSGAES